MAYTTINKSSQYFNTVLYTGNGSNNYSVTGNDFSADFIWFKCRSAGLTEHHLTDIIRGFGTGSSNTPTIQSNSTSAEFQRNIFSSTGVTSTGFSLNNYSDTNTNGATFVAWCWDANGAGVSNTAGTITSTVSANTTSGFSIVAYQGTSVAGTIGHGLGVAPKMIIIKRRTAFAEDWLVYHASLGATKNLKLNTTAAEATSSSPFNDTAPTSTVFSVSNDGTTNSSSSTYIAYCFAEVKGFSKFGSYTGNGSTDGTFVYTGFKPAYVMVKASSTTGQWAICDNKRGAANILNNNGEFLFAENSDATNSAPSNWDFLSNGFKARANYAANNTSGVTYIYMAFAENPFVSSTLIPTTAR